MSDRKYEVALHWDSEATVKFQYKNSVFFLLFPVWTLLSPENAIKHLVWIHSTFVLLFLKNCQQMLKRKWNLLWGSSCCYKLRSKNKTDSAQISLLSDNKPVSPSEPCSPASVTRTPSGLFGAFGVKRIQLFPFYSPTFWDWMFECFADCADTGEKQFIHTLKPVRNKSVTFINQI